MSPVMIMTLFTPKIIRICRDKPYSREACIEYAKRFDMNEKFAEYVKLYEDSTHSTKRTV